MTVHDTLRENRSETGGCRVVILYETEDALSKATALCEHLMTQVWKQIDIDLAHWSMSVLAHEVHGSEAADKAAGADILVVAAGAGGDFPHAFSQWADRWVTRRQHHEGALVGLLDPSSGGRWEGGRRDIVLHQLAVRAGMDYLTHLPQTPPRTIPDILDWCTSRAEARSGTLDKIIHTEPEP